MGGRRPSRENRHADAGDDRLVQDAAAGSHAAFAELYDRHHRAALSLARRLTKTDADAHDVVADTFAGVWRALNNGRGPRDAFRTYLLTSVRHNCGRHGRGESARRSAHSELPAFAEFPDIESGPDREVLAAAFSSLPERWQTVLWSAEVEEMSYAAIGQRLGIRRPAAIALARRARKGLGRAYLAAFATHNVGRSCAEVAPLIVDRVLGELTAAHHDRVERHLEACLACRDLSNDLRGLERGLRSLPPPLFALPAVGAAGRRVVGSLFSSASIGKLLVASSITASVGLGLTSDAPSRIDAAAESPKGDVASVFLDATTGQGFATQPRHTAADAQVVGSDAMPPDGTGATAAPITTTGVSPIGPVVTLPSSLIDVPPASDPDPRADPPANDGAGGQTQAIPTTTVPTTAPPTVPPTVPEPSGGIGVSVEIAGATIDAGLDGGRVDAIAGVVIPDLVDVEADAVVDVPALDADVDVSAAAADVVDAELGVHVDPERVDVSLDTDVLGLDVGVDVGVDLGVTLPPVVEDLTTPVTDLLDGLLGGSQT